jgi:hypothetical protein
MTLSKPGRVSIPMWFRQTVVVSRVVVHVCLKNVSVAFDVYILNEY